VKDLTKDRVGTEMWVTTPKRELLPGDILCTSAKLHYPATGLFEERITLSEASPDEIKSTPRRR
jgi:hypothetical protein